MNKAFDFRRLGPLPKILKKLRGKKGFLPDFDSKLLFCKVLFLSKLCVKFQMFWSFWKFR